MAESLRVKYATNDDEIGGINWGVIAPGSSADFKFRVYNDSELYRATGIEISLPDDSDHYVSEDGLVFAASLELPPIGPLANSEILTLRRVIPLAAADGVDSILMTINVDAWEAEVA